MPNWCHTTYIFKGKTNELKTLHDKIIEWTSKEFIETSFGENWLGNILYGAGLKDRIDNPNAGEILSCRGSLIDISDYIYDEGFKVWTETAWVPMAKMWNAVIEKLDLQSVGFSFEAEEPGCEIFWIYDPHNYNCFNEEVYIDSYGNMELDELDGYYKEQDAIKYLNEFFNTQFESLDSFKSLCEDYNDQYAELDCYIGVHRFEIDNEVYE